MDMDFPYFQNAAPQPYHPQQFVPLPPTPSQSNSISDDYNSNPSPPVRARFHTFKSNPLSVLTPVQDANYDFSFDNNYNHFPQNGGLSKTPLSAHHNHKPSLSTANNQNGRGGAFEIQEPLSLNTQNINPNGSNSDDDDNMTPAQSRRKAQNRAA
jgi:hypothetical protein